MSLNVPPTSITEPSSTTPVLETKSSTPSGNKKPARKRNASISNAISIGEGKLRESFCNILSAYLDPQCGSSELMLEIAGIVSTALKRIRVLAALGKLDIRTDLPVIDMTLIERLKQYEAVDSSEQQPTAPLSLSSSQGDSQNMNDLSDQEPTKRAKTESTHPKSSSILAQLDAVKRAEYSKNIPGFTELRSRIASATGLGSTAMKGNKRLSLTTTVGK